MASLRRSAPLAGLLVAELAAVGALHRLGGRAWARVPWAQLGAWLDGAGAVDALMAVLRLGALAVGWWLLATTVLTAAAGVARADGLAGWVRPLTWSLARAAVDRCVAAGVSAALVMPAAPAAAAVEPLPPPGAGEPADVESRDAGGDAGAATSGATGDAARGGAAAGEGAAGEPGQPRGEARPQAGVSHHEVVAGEHLWGIAAAHLAARRGVARAGLDEPDIATYWLRVVEANTDRLRSQDPDLVHPGERIILPPI